MSSLLGKIITTVMCAIVLMFLSEIVSAVEAIVDLIQSLDVYTSWAAAHSVTDFTNFGLMVVPFAVPVFVFAIMVWTWFGKSIMNRSSSAEVE